MSYTFLKLAEETLVKSNIPLTDKEIWDKSGDYGLHEKCNSTGKTPWKSIGAQIYTDMKNNDDSKFIIISKRPVKFGLKCLDISSNTTNKTYSEKSSSKDNIIKFNERDLHILFSTYVYSDPHFKCYTKTIYHEKSNKKQKGKNQWLHPDIVGVYFPFNDYKDSTIQIINSFSECAIKLFSFEIKIEIDFSTLREYFFQAVSNSSWANEGYLVALKYSDDSDLLDEMRRLNNSFGIGFIKLNPNNIEQSEILISAYERTSIDWQTVNRLVEENSDFKDFVDSINEDNKVSKVKSQYDKTLEPNAVYKYVEDKNIKD